MQNLKGNDFFYLELCKISIEIEKSQTLVEKTLDSLILQSQREIWILLCKKNHNRTFDVNPNLEKIEFFPKFITPSKKILQSLKGYIEIKKSHFANSKYKSQNICRFTFGTRDYFYTFLYYQQDQKEINIELCKKEVFNFLNQLYFEEIKYPISEKEYQIRLIIFSFFILFISSVGILIIIKKKKKS